MSEMSRGVIYYNRGNKMAVRLAVSIHSLRKFYFGPITILSEGDISHEFTYAIGAKYNCNVQDTVFNGTEGKNTTYLNACLVGNHTPYDTTVWIDSDTTCHHPFLELFEAAEKHEFAVAHFSDWQTTGTIGKRIESWRGILPDHWIERALEFGPAINCGVFAFNKKSNLVRDWWNLARLGQLTTRIPDEVCCQIMIAQPEYSHKIMPQIFNCSSKYGDQWIDNARIIHSHGNKHCRFCDETQKPLNNCLIWYHQFEEIRHEQFVKNYISKDRQLRKNVHIWDRKYRKNS